MYIYLYIYVHVCICMYIYREREREKERDSIHIYIMCVGSPKLRCVAGRASFCVFVFSFGPCGVLSRGRGG